MLVQQIPRKVPAALDGAEEEEEEVADTCADCADEEDELEEDSLFPIA